MNKADKKGLNEALDKVFDAHTVIESLAEAYREEFDELDEKAQEGERGQKLDEAASDLESLVEMLGQAIRTGETLGN